MSDKNEPLDLDELERVMEECLLLRNAFDGAISRQYRSTFSPPTVKRLIARARELEEFHSKWHDGSVLDYVAANNQLRERVAELENALTSRNIGENALLDALEDKAKQVEAWRAAAEALDTLDDISEVEAEYRVGCYMDKRAIKISEAVSDALAKARALGTEAVSKTESTDTEAPAREEG